MRVLDGALLLPVSFFAVVLYLLRTSKINFGFWFLQGLPRAGVPFHRAWLPLSSIFLEYLRSLWRCTVRAVVFVVAVGLCPTGDGGAPSYRQRTRAGEHPTSR